LLAEGKLHLLAVTRDDTASGFACLRFPDVASLVERTVPRVEMTYLRPLLLGLAPEGASPPVVSHPEGGWIDLRERIEAELGRQDALLMQQLRMVLLGLRNSLY
jgi:hypothetical protein